MKGAQYGEGEATAQRESGARLSKTMSRFLLEWGASLSRECPRDLLHYIQRRLTIEQAQAVCAWPTMRAKGPPDD